MIKKNSSGRILMLRLLRVIGDSLALAFLLVDSESRSGLALRLTLLALVLVTVDLVRHWFWFANVAKAMTALDEHSRTEETRWI